MIFACDQKQKKVIVSDVTLENVVPDDNFIEPPPPSSLHLSKSMTLKECFLKMCHREQPGPTDTAYNFSLHKTNNRYVVFFIESKAHKKIAQERAAKKGSGYLNKYYPLSKNELKDLNWKQAFDKIRSELKEFAKTEQFKNSSLAKAKSITIRFDDAEFLKLK